MDFTCALESAFVLVDVEELESLTSSLTESFLVALDAPDDARAEALLRVVFAADLAVDFVLVFLDLTESDLTSSALLGFWVANALSVIAGERRAEKWPSRNV